MRRAKGRAKKAVGRATARRRRRAQEAEGDGNSDAHREDASAKVVEEDRAAGSSTISLDGIQVIGSKQTPQSLEDATHWTSLPIGPHCEEVQSARPCDHDTQEQVASTSGSASEPVVGNDAIEPGPQSMGGSQYHSSTSGSATLERQTSTMASAELAGQMLLPHKESRPRQVIYL